jgi:hypothetical protein
MYWPICFHGADRENFAFCIITIIIIIIFIIRNVALLFWMLLMFVSSLLITENFYQSFYSPTIVQVIVLKTRINLPLK